MVVKPLTTDMEISATRYIDSEKSAPVKVIGTLGAMDVASKMPPSGRSHEARVYPHDSILSGGLVGRGLGQKGRVRGNLIVDFGPGIPGICNHN